MVAMNEVLRQFHQLNVKPSRWAQGEIKELANILAPGEKITHVVFGWYDNGFGLLCCTEYRVLLIDKKPFFLKLEDLRYDKISEVKFLNRLLDASIILSYAGVTLTFKSWGQGELRRLTDYIQHAITVINNQHWQIAEQDEVYRGRIPRPTVEQLAISQEEHDLAPTQALSSYPDELMQQATVDLGLMKNPYAATNKYVRRRVPNYSFNQTSR